LATREDETYTTTGVLGSLPSLHLIRRTVSCQSLFQTDQWTVPMEEHPQIQAHDCHRFRTREMGCGRRPLDREHPVSHRLAGPGPLGRLTMSYTSMGGRSQRGYGCLGIGIMTRRYGEAGFGQGTLWTSRSNVYFCCCCSN
jgi:hypothetical protein